MNHEGEIAAFDLDGTLVNSGAQIFQCLQKVLGDALEVTISPLIVFQNLGQPLDYILGQIDVPIEFRAEIIRLFRSELETEILRGNDVYDGVVDVLTSLRLRGYSIVVATTKPTYLAKLVVFNSKLDGLVDYVQGTDNFPPKPNPEILSRISQGLHKNVTFMFGDRTEDMSAAKSFSSTAIGVAQGAHSRSMLFDSGADWVFSSFPEMFHSKFFITGIPRV